MFVIWASECGKDLGLQSSRSFSDLRFWRASIAQKSPILVPCWIERGFLKMQNLSCLLFVDIIRTPGVARPKGQRNPAICSGIIQNLDQILFAILFSYGVFKLSLGKKHLKTRNWRHCHWHNHDVCWSALGSCFELWQTGFKLRFIMRSSPSEKNLLIGVL